MAKPTPRRIFGIALALGGIASLYFVPWAIVFAWLAPLPDTVQEQVDAALKHDFDGIIVYVDQAGKDPAWYTAGWHDRDKQIPARPDALFKIASITKLYNAVALTKLVHSGRLSLDKTVGDYFPDLVGKVANAESATLRMLVKHRSGIPNFTDTPNYWNTPAESAEDALGRIEGLEADFAPDSRYAYCNTNFLLLAMIMDKVLGYSHYQYLQDSVLTPRGMTQTFGSMEEVNLDDIMSGYYVGVEEDFKTADNGSMLATAADLGSFLRALNDGSLFEEGEYALYGSIYVFDHTGLMPGYQSIAKYHKDIDAVVIQFVNTTNFSGYTWNLGEVVYGRVVKLVGRGV